MVWLHGGWREIPLRTLSLVGLARLADGRKSAVTTRLSPSSVITMKPVGGRRMRMNLCGNRGNRRKKIAASRHSRSFPTRWHPSQNTPRDPRRAANGGERRVRMLAVHRVLVSPQLCRAVRLGMSSDPPASAQCTGAPYAPETRRPPLVRPFKMETAQNVLAGCH